MTAPRTKGIKSRKITFVGDVHGWPERLEEILAQSGPPWCFVGDLIDRGPDSRAVVARVRALCEAGRAWCLVGNHEFALLRGLGVPERGIEPYPNLFAAWWVRYGGRETARSYGVTSPDSQHLRRALGDDLDWLAGLPWYLRGMAGGKRWLAVHAGLDETPYRQQLAVLEPEHCWDRAVDDLPAVLYSKQRRTIRPPDLPADCCLVSGHTPLERCYLRPGRILCDTSGGKRGRPLSAVVYPEEVILQTRAEG